MYNYEPIRHDTVNCCIDMQESSLDWGEVEEALVMVRERKSQGLDSTPTTSELQLHVCTYSEP